MKTKSRFRKLSQGFVHFFTFLNFNWRVRLRSPIFLTYKHFIIQCLNFQLFQFFNSFFCLYLSDFSTMLSIIEPCSVTSPVLLYDYSRFIEVNTRRANWFFGVLEEENGFYWSFFF